MPFDLKELCDVDSDRFDCWHLTQSDLPLVLRMAFEMLSDQMSSRIGRQNINRGISFIHYIQYSNKAIEFLQFLLGNLSKETQAGSDSTYTEFDSKRHNVRFTFVRN